jgi:predicted Rdx family selenoprotein
VRATDDLLSNYQHVISSLTLHTGGTGVFDVTVDDTVLYSKAETGRHAEPGEVLALFTTLVGPDVPRYGDDEV